ncbi:MAG TPA: Ig-like domain-containing protein [Flavobacteriaceae bacterium]|nr:Ig-like domain-containing protein [Flavobacteriaceae bacterium]
MSNFRVNSIRLVGLLFFVLFLVRCSSDDSGKYQPIATVTQPDEIEVNQNASVVIPFLENDTNIPIDAEISLSAALNGNAAIQTNATDDTVLDDTVLYTPDANFTGTDTFSYYICSPTNAEDCVEGLITVTVLPVSGVAYQIDQEPHPALSDYLFFEQPLQDLIPTYGVLLYEPINSLFSDYAHKKRFIWMPQGVSAAYVDDASVLDFPLGTILIKNFYYENVQPNNQTLLLETRLMLKTSSGWEFANYVWNEEQTDAFLDMEGSYKTVDWLENGVPKSVNYRIPSEAECFTCHKSGPVSIPIGPKPQNLNKNLVYSGIAMNQLQKLIEVGYLENSVPQSINTVVPWDDATQSLDLRMRSYADINCAHCHSDERHCDYRPMRFAFNESENEVNLGVCVEPEELFDGLTHIVSPGNINRSMLYFRVSTTLAQRRMPLLGRTIVHEEAVAMIEEWINSLTTVCQ